MSRGNKWIPLDKYLAQEFKSIKREFSMIEAMFSYTLDVDNGVNGSISGYSKLWGWSRNKVRRFIKCIRTGEGHVRDRKRTHDGHPIHFIDKDIMGKKDMRRTGEGQEKDRREDSTINPNPKPNKIYTDKSKEFVVNYINFISKTYPTKSPKSKNLINNSLDVIDKLTRLDGFEEDYIFDSIRWAQKDDFWKSQVYSIAGLRKKSSNGLTKFQNLSIAYEKDMPESNNKNLTKEQILEKYGL